MDVLSQLKLSVVRRDDSSTLPSVLTPGGKLYVVSEEGLEYNVVANLPDVYAPHPPRPGMCLGVHLYLDGTEVGYWYTMGIVDGHMRTSATFDGFAESVGHSTGGNNYSTSYRNFKFAKATPGNDGGPQVADPEQIKAGRITAKLCWYQDNGARQAPPVTGRSGPGASLGHLPEGKKFFLAPSLKTDKGRASQRDIKWSARDYVKVQDIGEVEVRYETASTLMLRNHLSKTNAAHRALLRHSRDPTVLALLGYSDDDEEDEGTSPPRRLNSGAGGSQPRVKRERGGGGGGGGGGAGPRVKREVGSVFLDLTKPPDHALKVNGRELAADEVAFCDLAASSDDEAGGGGGGGGGGARWEVRKRQAVEIDGGEGGEDGEGDA